MAYIYRKTIHGRPYYYLRISKRVKGKIVVKDVAYLGNDITKIEDSLKELPKKYKEEIRKAYSNIKKFIQSGCYIEKAKKLKLRYGPFLKKENLLGIEAARLHFKNHFLKLDKETIKDAYKDFLIDFAFNTTSIEGNTITLAEANKLLRENLTPKNRTLREIYDLQNTEKTFFYLLKSELEINHNTIILIHDMLMENIDRRKEYRNHDIRIFKSRFEATPFKFIKTDMGILLNWLKKNSKLHPFVAAGIFHQKFEKIHPFSDGNGRTGRMVMNYLLMKKGYPPLIVKKSNRSRYLETLTECDKAGLNKAEPIHYKSLVNYLAEELIDSYWQNFNI